MTHYFSDVVPAITVPLTYPEQVDSRNHEGKPLVPAVKATQAVSYQVRPLSTQDAQTWARQHEYVAILTSRQSLTPFKDCRFGNETTFDTAPNRLGGNAPVLDVAAGDTCLVMKYSDATGIVTFAFISGIAIDSHSEDAEPLHLNVTG